MGSVRARTGIGSRGRATRELGNQVLNDGSTRAGKFGLVIRFLRRRFSLGRIGRRKLGGGWDEGKPFGRGEIVAEFHRVRKLDHPPVLVVQGVRGSKKSELLDHMRRSFTLRRSWYRAEEVDAKVDFFAISPEPEPTFASIDTQLRSNGSWVRRLHLPRFRRMQALLSEEQGGRSAMPVHSGAAENDLAWLEAMGQPIPSIVVQRRADDLSSWGRATRYVREIWWRHSPGRAARWMREFTDRLPDPMAGPGSLRRRLEMLQTGLGVATAEDLRRATRRFVLPVSEVALFFDGYHRVERTDQPNFVVEFAEAVAESKARVLMVVACRRQAEWSKMAEAQPDCEEYGPMTICERVQIHRLEPLAWGDRIYALRKYGVPASLVHDLAEFSAGMPIALGLLGEAFGTVDGGDSRHRALLQRLPLQTGPEDEWFETLSRTLVNEMLAGLGRDEELHLQAAASQRNFDRDLLARLLGDRFSDACFKWLITSEFVGTPRPSSVLRTTESYRVRSFVREIFATTVSNHGEVEDWHQRSAQYLSDGAARASDPDLEFQLEAEALYHRLFTEPELAKSELFQWFNAQLHASRTDRCETLLWIGLRYNWADPAWRATVLTHAGKMYLARNQNELAMQRLLEAKATVELDGSDPSLRAPIALALARCYLLEERFLESREEFAWLGDRESQHPVVRFQCLWAECREERDSGELTASRELTDEAKALLEELLDGSRVTDSISVAKSLGLGSLPRKRAHIVRHEAELARRLGDYVTSEAKVDDAHQRYSVDPEEGIEGYTNLVRAHNRRHEGAFDDSIELAFEIYDGFMRQEPRDLRGAGWALRCLAQAHLCAADPEAALSALDEIMKIDPLVFPQALPFGLFGKATLERHRGNYGQARKLLRQADQEQRGRAATYWRFHHRIERIELDRIQSPLLADREIRALLNQPRVEEHPTLQFSAALLGVRTLGREGAYVETAERSADRIRCGSRAGSWEVDTLSATLAEIDAGREPPPLILNLP